MMNDLPDPILLLQHYIGGRPRAPRSGRYFRQSESGATAARLPQACAEDVDIALDAAELALADWQAQGLFQRRLWLRHVAGELRRNRFRLVEAECRELNLSIPQARDVVLRLVDEQCRRPARDSMALRSGPRELTPIADAKPCVTRLLLPEGVSLSAVSERLMPLLAAGNTLVVCVLHRPDQPASARLMQFLHTVAGCLPEGVLNAISGLVLEAGGALADSPRAADFLLLPQTGARRCQCGRCRPPSLH